jgi:hypothetical protein
VGFLVCLFLDRSLYLLNYKKSSFLTSFLIFSFSGARKTVCQAMSGLPRASSPSLSVSWNPDWEDHGGCGDGVGPEAMVSLFQPETPM